MRGGWRDSSATLPARYEGYHARGPRRPRGADCQQVACPGTRRSRSRGTGGVAAWSLLVAVSVLRPLPASAANNGQFSIYRRCTRGASSGHISRRSSIRGAVRRHVRDRQRDAQSADAPSLRLRCLHDEGGWLRPPAGLQAQEGTWGPGSTCRCPTLTIPPRSGDIVKFTYNPPPKSRPATTRGALSPRIRRARLTRGGQWGSSPLRGRRRRLRAGQGPTRTRGWRSPGSRSRRIDPSSRSSADRWTPPSPTRSPTPVTRT